MPFLDYYAEIRRVICTTNAVELITANNRRAVRVRGHFSNEASAIKCLYLAASSIDPTGEDRARWAMSWNPALNAFVFFLRPTAQENHSLMKTAGFHTPFF